MADYTGPFDPDNPPPGVDPAVWKRVLAPPSDRRLSADEVERLPGPHLPRERRN